MWWSKKPTRPIQRLDAEVLLEINELKRDFGEGLELHSLHQKLERRYDVIIHVNSRYHWLVVPGWEIEYGRDGIVCDFSGTPQQVEAYLKGKAEGKSDGD